ncbi:MAG: tRNA (cytidine(56)-2'-O)-methyltransferase [Candidatus Bathyarchaeota archaeon]|nr:tRNA (cytidine(56)-2'-O)-methyltransferase [Candidatus Bathyarchaeota archaeon]
MKIYILRWGHRQRDYRVTSHIALTARALGASGFILADLKDFSIQKTIEKITKNWGGTFNFSMGIPFKNVVNEWRKNNGIIVHLTAYGENIETSDILNRIKSHKKDIMLIVGSKKVPSRFYSERISDYNLAIGNQPHSEIAALAVFLDRIYEGKELSKTFQNAKLKILPSKRRKTIIESDQNRDKNC